MSGSSDDVGSVMVVLCIVLHLIYLLLGQISPADLLLYQDNAHTERAEGHDGDREHRSPEHSPPADGGFDGRGHAGSLWLDSGVKTCQPLSRLHWP